MENLSRIAEGIFLGNGEVWNFLDYAVNRNCGGLLYRTKQMGLLGANLSKNFEGGHKRKYEYGELPTFSVYSLKPGTNIHGRGGMIGELYSVPSDGEILNSSLNFLTKESFTALYESVKKDNIARKENPNFQKEIEGEPAQYANFTVDPKFPFNRSKGVTDYAKKETSKTLLEFATEARSKKEPKARKLLTDNFEGSLNPDGYKVTVNADEYGKVLIDTNRHNLSDYIEKNNGLIDFHSFVREKYKSKLNNIQYPQTISEPWTSSKSYGIEYNNKGEEHYSINEKNTFKGDVSISSDFNGGSQTQFILENNTRKYTLYQEGGVDALNKSDNVSDGSVVSLSDYDGASRLLRRTNQLFKETKIGSLINRFHTSGVVEGGEFLTAYDSKYGMSRGRNLLKKDKNGNVIVDNSSGYDNPYCRVWTAHHQYSHLKDRIRPFVDEDSGSPLSISQTQSNYGLLRPGEGLSRLNNHSVLGADGFVKITPTYNESGNLTQDADKLKNYMFSIENLAWRDVAKNTNSNALSKEQRGPNGGRIMWFPPYNLKFSENVNVNWNANSFIGRGEEIYTYTNTVRSGTLDFTLLIDHPSIINKWRGRSKNIADKEKREEDLLRFFAGCGNLNEEVVPLQNNKETSGSTNSGINTTPTPTEYSKKIAYVIFFPNDFSGKDYVNKGKIDEAIEILSSYNKGGSYSKRDESYKDEVLQSHNLTSIGFDPSSYQENIKKQLLGNYGDDIEIHFFDDLLEINGNFNGHTIFGQESENCKIKNVIVKGFASSHGYVKNNIALCERRRTFIQKLIEYKCQELSESNVDYIKEVGSTISVPDIDGREDVNLLNAKLARAAYAVVEVSWKEENVAHEGYMGGNEGGYTAQGMISSEGTTANTTNAETNIMSTTYYSDEEYTYDNEYLYFANVRENQILYKNIVEKIRYFDPAYHSITPEGFNARLNFLHQCTRQGPTNAVSSGRVKGSATNEDGEIVSTGSDEYLKFAGNLAFGRAPYCILRIGDFFNTKICIESMSINYDNGGGPQWDLNPEGVGVQPMFANISISFKFLGGQDLTGPIERLQNAVTANYYANSSVYNRHADNDKFYYDALEDNNGTIE